LTIFIDLFISSLPLNNRPNSEAISPYREIASYLGNSKTFKDLLDKEHFYNSIKELKILKNLILTSSEEKIS
jgi:hypothetical protein